MKIKRNSWWYWVPAQFNSDLLSFSNRPRDLCSLVRSLAFGWLTSISVCLVAVCIFIMILISVGAFWWAVLFPLDRWEDGLSMLVFSGAFNALALYLLIWTPIDYHYRINARWKAWLFERKYSAKHNVATKQPGVLSAWLKGIKDKTCILVDIE